MQLFELIVKLSSVLHGTSIKLGYHKEYLFFKTSPPNDFQIKTFFFDTLKANLIKSGFDLKMIVKIFSETLK